MNTDEIIDHKDKRKSFSRSDAISLEDDRLKTPIRLVNSQTRPALSSSLSKDSTGYTDATGIDLTVFIKETLHKNHKDRQHVLHLEQVFRQFLEDPSKKVFEFPNMTSYDRMIVHRVAAFFGLDHNVTQDGQSVVVTKTDYATAPPFPFKSLIENDQFTEKPRRNSSSRYGGMKPFQKFPDFGETDPRRRTKSVDMPSGSVYSPIPFYAQSQMMLPTNVTGDGRKKRMNSHSSTASESTCEPDYSQFISPVVYPAGYPSPLPYGMYPANPVVLSQATSIPAGALYYPSASLPYNAGNPPPTPYYN
ncbi:unnamed protein product [Bursaphelenchus xylophilus]|uniref:(pine wood nematode) hypothetical protein n=1 Tax=Bursaphelenchus xylophilus TaxID=6326 RepID=A0A1I7SSX4_BURXY|nr:unnamed protein product [Bursaphelenchus xylophilus]CAG9108848.1 unnamed protein product [Bursaphelenchus xylophilus]